MALAMVRSIRQDAELSEYDRCDCGLLLTPNILSILRKDSSDSVPQSAHSFTRRDVFVPALVGPSLSTSCGKITGERHSTAPGIFQEREAAPGRLEYLQLEMAGLSHSCAQLLLLSNFCMLLKRN